MNRAYPTHIRYVALCERGAQDALRISSGQLKSGAQFGIKMRYLPWSVELFQPLNPFAMDYGIQ